ncbi:MAG: hypothetical protein WKF59_09710 [Chitinophagaceae bacterium]
MPLSAKFSDYNIQKVEIRGEVLMTRLSFKKYNEHLGRTRYCSFSQPS